MGCFRAAKSRFALNLIGYTVMENHLHLIVAAKSDESLRKGLQGLGIRLARTVNRIFGRSGKVFRERFFARALRTKRAVYYALRYAVQNARKHGFTIPDGAWDPYSSGRFHRDSHDTPVEDRPVVMRAFLPGAGTRGIAIGLPVGVHYGFDAQAVRLVDVWQGEFLDASGSWAGRGGNTVGGLGPTIWTAPAGMPFVLRMLPAIIEPVHASVRDGWPDATGADAGFRFRGYRLDGDGYPTLLYTVRDLASGVEVEVAERVEAQVAPRTRLLRRFELNALGRDTTLWFRGGSEGSFRSWTKGRAWSGPDEVRWSDEATWYRASSREGRMICELEILP